MSYSPMKPSTPEQIAAVKALRVQADELMQSVKDFTNEYGDSRAASLMFTNAELAKMYGGKRLEELGTEFPAELADKSRPEQKAAEVAQAETDKLKPGTTSTAE